MHVADEPLYVKSAVKVTVATIFPFFLYVLVLAAVLELERLRDGNEITLYSTVSPFCCSVFTTNVYCWIGENEICPAWEVIGVQNIQISKTKIESAFFTDISSIYFYFIISMYSSDSITSNACSSL